MTREWKPGDVALVTGPVGGHVAVLIGHDPSKRCWHAARHNGDLDCLAADAVVEVRPLVVIDPEDREAVSALVRAHCNYFDHRSPVQPEEVTAMQAALRSLITPPKPDEPTGLGAVVEDAEGEFWVAADDDNARWFHRIDKSAGEFRRWDEVAAVKVLSEGVTP